jgi:hypothetical protein
MSAQAAIGANIGTRPEKLAGPGIGGRIGNAEMNAVGSQPLGKLGIVLDEASDSARLDKIDNAPGPSFIHGRLAAAKQDASRIGACKFLPESSFEHCRRLGGKLQVEPASRLDFSHYRGLRRPLPHQPWHSACLKSYGSRRCQSR